MIACPIPENEFLRLRDLRAINILDTAPDLRFELAVSFLASKLNAPMVLITLIDANRQWFKAAYGVEAQEVPRNISICAHAICEVTESNPDDRLYEISDLKADLRFFKNPLVADEPKCRSYISYVLQSESGKNIGTLCVVDVQARLFTAKEKALIIHVGQVVDELINSYKNNPL